MIVNDQQQQMLQQLPGVDRLIQSMQEDASMRALPKSVKLRAIRETLDELRAAILNDPDAAAGLDLSQPAIRARAERRAQALHAYRLQRTINATGVVVHTNLGRSCLADEAIEHLLTVAGRYSNLEYDLAQGRRGSRYSIVEDLLCEISGAEAAMAVNNNAAAVLLSLDTLARGKSVLISRGELVEIGGSFRIPDVMAKSGADLKEVGTTNRTHLRDYESAIGGDTGLLLKVHTSNYAIVGFTKAVPLADLVALGAKVNLPVMEDLGSGNFIDYARFGMSAEPTVQASVAAGADVVTFSGDKLLGGPQAGLIVGRRAMLERIKANPLTRALRIDKLTLAALEATLRLYRDESEAISRIPTLRMLTASLPEIEGRAHQLAEALQRLPGGTVNITLRRVSSLAGGGSLPLLDLPSCCVAVDLKGVSANTIEVFLRRHTPPVIGRIEDDRFILDARTLMDDEIPIVAEAFGALVTKKTNARVKPSGHRHDDVCISTQRERE